MTFEDKRNKMEKLIYDVFNALDPTGRNTEYYKSIFVGMSDNKFKEFFNNLFSDDNEYLIWHDVDHETSVNIENIEKAANILGVELDEYVAMPHINGSVDNPVVTRYKCPVGYLHIKKPQQIREKKNGLSTDIEKRSSLTGQVSGDDKNGRQSDLENSLMVSIGAEHILAELNGPRSDDLTMKRDMYAEIHTKGYTTLSSLENSLENKTTLNTVNVFFLGMCLATDLVNDDNLFEE